MKLRSIFGVTALVVGGMMMVGPATAEVFPPAGQDYYANTHMMFEIELLAMPGVWLPANLYGPILVDRSDPYPYTLLGGQEAINTEMVSMDMIGNVGGMPAELGVASWSPGMIIDTDPDPADSFPAFSFFDIFFDVTVYGTPLGDLTLHNIDPFRPISEISEVPPNLLEDPYGAGDDFEYWYEGHLFRGGWIPIAEWTARDPFANIQMSPLALYDPDGVHIANLDTASACHEPEPATLSLLALGAMVVLKRRTR